MVHDEGLCSYKAIAFIKKKGNPNRLGLKKKSHLILSAFLQSTVLSKQKTLRGLSKNLGDKLWIK